MGYTWYIYIYMIDLPVLKQKGGSYLNIPPKSGRFSSWTNHQNTWAIFQQVMFDCRLYWLRHYTYPVINGLHESLAPRAEAVCLAWLYVAWAFKGISRGLIVVVARFGTRFISKQQDPGFLQDCVSILRTALDMFETGWEHQRAPVVIINHFH